MTHFTRSDINPTASATTVAAVPAVPAVAAVTAVGGGTDDNKAMNNINNNKNVREYEIGYVTDVEGNWQYFYNYLMISSTLAIHSTSSHPLPSYLTSASPLLPSSISTPSISSSSTLAPSVAMSAPTATLTASTGVHAMLNVEDIDRYALPLVLRDGCYFVYGGDAVDKGNGDIRVVCTLIALKRKYPDRVFLLMGNRDNNKQKLSAELDPEEIKTTAVTSLPPPYWVTDVKQQVTPLQYLQSLQQQQQKQQSSTTATAATGGAGTIDSLDENLLRLNTRVNRLKYLLCHTMGAETTFEYRRQEIALLCNRSTESVSDEEVCESFHASVMLPSGFMRLYIQLSQLAVVIGSTLYVHGAADARSLMYLPSHCERDDVHQLSGSDLVSTHSIQQWVKRLNTFAKEEIEDWTKQLTWKDLPSGSGSTSSHLTLGQMPCIHTSHPYNITSSSSSSSGSDSSDVTKVQKQICLPSPSYRYRGGQALMAYGYGPAMKWRTVMITTNFDERSGNPRKLSADAEEIYHRSGINRVIVGHKPWGDTPTIIQHKHVEIISADQSYGDVDNKKNPRGDAVAEILVTVYSRPPTSHCHHTSTTATAATATATAAVVRPTCFNRSDSEVPTTSTTASGCNTEQYSQVTIYGRRANAHAFKFNLPVRCCCCCTDGMHDGSSKVDENDSSKWIGYEYKGWWCKGVFDSPPSAPIHFTSTTTPTTTSSTSSSGGGGSATSTSTTNINSSSNSNSNSNSSSRTSTAASSSSIAVTCTGAVASLPAATPPAPPPVPSSSLSSSSSSSSSMMSSLLLSSVMSLEGVASLGWSSEWSLGQCYLMCRALGRTVYYRWASLHQLSSFNLHHQQQQQQYGVHGLSSPLASSLKTQQPAAAAPVMPTLSSL